MIVLGLDTATPCTAVGLLLADGHALQARDDPGPGEHPGHATRLLTMADELLAAAGVGWDALDRIAVGIGPGTFTGLRVGIATARGLAQSLSVELVGVGSLRALARRAAQPATLAVIDARRGEVFAAAYAAAGEDSVAELVAPCALAPERVGHLVARAGEQDGGGARRWVAVGDGATRYRDRLQSASIAVPPGSSTLHRVDARTVCELGASGQPASAYELVLPDYRRVPDAESARRAAGAARPEESGVLEGTRR